MIENLDDILKLNEEDEYKLILKDNDLDKAVFELKQIGYEPQIGYTAGRTTEVKMDFTHQIGKKQKKVYYSIVNPNFDRDRIDEDIAVDEEEVYNNISEEMFKFNRQLLCENYKSYYNEVDVQILDECRTIVAHGMMRSNVGKEVETDERCSIDTCKAFTHQGSKINYIPVFKEFDVWKPYDHTCDFNRFNNYTLYYVQANQGNIFFNKKFNLVYGKYLKELVKRGVVMKILYYKTPSQVLKVKYKKAIGELFKSNISADEEQNNKIKKTIANITFGLMEKSYNRKSVSRIFDNVGHALHHQRTHGGRLYVLDDEEYECFNKWQLLNDDEWSIELSEDERPYFQHVNGSMTFPELGIDCKVEDGKTYYSERGEKYRETEKISNTAKYYVVCLTNQRKLMNGFRYIKELLLQGHNFNMYEAYEKLKANSIKVYAVKTDAFHITKKDVRKAKKLLDFHNDIGGWRVENNKVYELETDYNWKFNELVKIPTFQNETIPIEDEWDVESICNKIVEKRRVMIRARFAGSGKSFIGKYMENLGYNTLFVVPQNMLKQEIECEAVTVNTFFSIPVDKGDDLPKFDYSDFQCIVFDEIYMSSPYILNKIRVFANNNPDIVIIGAGDVKQLPPIEPFTNTQNAGEYIDKCIDIIFEYNIFLKICKRVGGKDTEEGERNRKKLNEIYDDFWVKKMAVEEWIVKHFKFTKDVMKSRNNIAYTNIRCEAVSNEIRKRLGKTCTYEIGEILICRLYKKDKEGKLNVNIRWKVVNNEGYKITIQDIKDAENIRTLDIDIVDKHFRYAYCATTHSRQGTSISDNMTIHEWNKDYLVCREWLWCSITRCRDFNNVYFFKNKECEEDMFKSLVINYFKNKVEGYKQQDRVAKREIDEEQYIDENWCLKYFKSCCQNCGIKFNLDTRGGKISSNFTAQRCDNELCHTVENCTAFCVYCNCSAS